MAQMPQYSLAGRGCNAQGWVEGKQSVMSSGLSAHAVVTLCGSG